MKYIGYISVFVVLSFRDFVNFFIEDFVLIVFRIFDVFGLLFNVDVVIKFFWVIVIIEF